MTNKLSEDERILLARREYQREWRQNNKKHVQEYHKKWREENPDKVEQNNRRYWLRKADELEAK